MIDLRWMINDECLSDGMKNLLAGGIKKRPFDLFVIPHTPLIVHQSSFIQHSSFIFDRSSFTSVFSHQPSVIIQHASFIIGCSSFISHQSPVIIHHSLFIIHLRSKSVYVAQLHFRNDTGVQRPVSFSGVRAFNTRRSTK